MPRAVRVQTDYKGVSYVEKNDERIFYITYRRPESRKLYEEKVGRSLKAGHPQGVLQNVPGGLPGKLRQMKRNTRLTN